MNRKQNEVITEPTRCIYCDSDLLQSETINAECYSRKVICLECDKKWFEIFEFAGIETTE